MNNYERSALAARALFLTWDQPKMIEKYRLRADAQYLYLRFLGEEYRIHRRDGRVECLEGGIQPADFHAMMVLYDYLCREGEPPCMCGRWVRTHALKNAALTCPSDVKLYQRYADAFQTRQDALKRAAAQIGTPFPQGDIAFRFPIFDGMDGVFQFWAGDEEFPPSVRFLWDDTLHHYLKFETVWFVCGKLFSRILREMGNEFSSDASK